MKLTILFDDPYYVGLLEVEHDNCLYAAQHIFGADPSDQEVYEFVQGELLALQAHMSIGIPIEAVQRRPVNPKRKQREIRREVTQQGVSSRAHEAMRVQIEHNKQARQQITRQQRDLIKAHKRSIARTKAKARQRGR